MRLVRVIKVTCYDEYSGCSLYPGLKTGGCIVILIDLALRDDGQVVTSG